MPEFIAAPAGQQTGVDRLRVLTMLFVRRLGNPVFALGAVMFAFTTSSLLQSHFAVADMPTLKAIAGDVLASASVSTVILLVLRGLGDRAIVSRVTQRSIVTRRISAAAMLVIAVPVSTACTYLFDRRIIGDIGPWELRGTRSALLMTLVGVAWIFIAGFVATVVTVVIQVTIGQRDDIARTLAERDASNAALLDAHMETRRMIAEELHGHVQGRLVSMSRRIRNGQLSDPNEIALILDGFAVETVREMSHNMYPSELPISVSAALQRLCGSDAQLDISDSFMDIDTVSDNPLISTKLRESIYFCAEEALTNAIKHSGGESICIRLDEIGRMITLEVTNSCDEEHAEWDLRATHSDSFGMRLINAWVGRCSGTWSLVCDGHGTTRFRAEFERLTA